MACDAVNEITVRLGQLRALREDAICRGNLELAITYGWSMIRLSEERLIDALAPDDVTPKKDDGSK
jgi:hypothetical protein